MTLNKQLGINVTFPMLGTAAGNLTAAMAPSAPGPSYSKVLQTPKNPPTPIFSSTPAPLTPKAGLPLENGYKGRVQHVYAYTKENEQRQISSLTNTKVKGFLGMKLVGLTTNKDTSLKITTAAATYTLEYNNVGKRGVLTITDPRYLKLFTTLIENISLDNNGITMQFRAWLPEQKPTHALPDTELILVRMMADLGRNPKNSEVRRPSTSTTCGPTRSTVLRAYIIRTLLHMKRK